MIIDLSKHELKQIDEALQAWEVQPISNVAFSCMITAVFCPKELREEESIKSKSELRNAELESNDRKKASLLMRTKLYQAEARATEHELT